MNDDIRSGKTPHISKSNSLSWNQQTKEAVLNVVSQAVEDVVDARTDQSLPASVETSTLQVCEEYDYLESLAVESLLDIQHEIAEDHPFIDIDPIDESMSAEAIREAGQRSLIEFCKRQALHEVRRRQFQHESLGDSLEERIYW